MKWVASIVLVLGLGLNGLNIYPFGHLIILFGSLLMAYGTYVLRDWALVFLNTMCVVIGLATLGYGLIY